MIVVDEQANQVVGSSVRVDSFYEFFNARAKQLEQDFKDALENLTVYEELITVRNENIENGVENDPNDKMGRCINS